MEYKTLTQTFNSSQMRGYRARLKAAINKRLSGEIILERGTALKLIAILDQAIHTEEGHGN